MTQSGGPEKVPPLSPEKIGRGDRTFEGNCVVGDGGKPLFAESGEIPKKLQAVATKAAAACCSPQNAVNLIQLPDSARENIFLFPLGSGFSRQVREGTKEKSGAKTGGGMVHSRPTEPERSGDRLCAAQGDLEGDSRGADPDGGGGRRLVDERSLAGMLDRFDRAYRQEIRDAPDSLVVAAAAHHRLTWIHPKNGVDGFQKSGLRR